MDSFFFSFICGIQAIFTVGGKESLTVSNYLKNKTTHTKQNKSKIYAANCWETQKPQLPVIKIFLPTIIKQRIWRASVYLLSASHARSWQARTIHMLEWRLAVRWWGVRPGFTNMWRSSLHIPALVLLSVEPRTIFFFLNNFYATVSFSLKMRKTVLTFAGGLVCEMN